MSAPMPALAPNASQAFVIDDDDDLRHALAFLLGSRGVRVMQFASAEAFLERFEPTLRGCILTVVRMAGPVSYTHLTLPTKRIV